MKKRQATPVKIVELKAFYNLSTNELSVAFSLPAKVIEAILKNRGFKND